MAGNVLNTIQVNSTFKCWVHNSLDMCTDYMRSEYMQSDFAHVGYGSLAGIIAALAILVLLCVHVFCCSLSMMQNLQITGASASISPSG